MFRTPEYKRTDLAMEEMHMAASAYYNNSSRDLQQQAADFFRSMDVDGDGRISYNEFVAFFTQCGYHFRDTDFFRGLDRNGDNSLDFGEVLTLYYIMKTRGVWCKGCSVCLLGLYFTCVKCFDEGHNTYDLCAACYNARNFAHHHNSFLDSYLLLRSRRGLSPGATNRTVALVPQPRAGNGTPWGSFGVAFQALERGLDMWNALSLCGIM